jgi:hypothetical protein
LSNHDSVYEEKYNLEDVEIIELDREKSTLRFLSEDNFMIFTNYQGNLYFIDDEFVGFGLVLFDNNYHFFPEESISFFRDYLPKEEGAVFDLYLGEDNLNSSFSEKNYFVELNSLTYEGEDFIVSFPIYDSENNSVEIYFRSKLIR